MFVDAMEHINITQFKIEKHYKRIQKYTIKKHLQYLKSRNKKIHHISKNMVNVLNNFNITMCHTFI
jgi:hypothetical protein